MGNWKFIDVKGSSLDTYLPLVAEFIEEQAGLEKTFEPVAEWQSRFKSFMMQVLAGGDYTFRVALQDGEIVGFVMFGVTYEPLFRRGRQGYITDLFVRRSHRGKGLEKALAESAIETLRAREVDTLQLNVLLANHEAVDMWKSLGFEPFVVRMKLEC